MKGSSQLENRILFLLLLAFEIFHLFYLVLAHRMPLGHDGFQYFSLQYFFLNDSAVNGEAPLWIPYVNHGITATWWYAIQGTVGILPNALLLFGHMISSVNFLDIFHYGIFVDRLLLLTGVWLLGERYFESGLTRFFVTSCVMGSTITMTQFKFTFHLFYGVPLLLYFGHAFLDSGRFRYFFLACNIFMIQMIGNDAYFFPIITMTVFIYFLFYALDQPAHFAQQIKGLRWGLPSLGWITASLLSIGLLASIMVAGKDHALVNLNYGRNLDGSTPLNVFLTYAGNMGFQKWQELIFRVSPALDFTVYIGFLSLPLVFIGLFFSHHRMKKTILLVAMILLFFSMGTWVSVFFYNVWPTMKFYRHLSMIVPLMKLFLLFLAGFGFEKIFIQRESWQGRRVVSYACLMLGVMLLLLSIYLNGMADLKKAACDYIYTSMSMHLPHMPWGFSPDLISIKLAQASIFALMTSFVFLFLPLNLFNKCGYLLILAILTINSADIYGYYCAEINARTFPLTKDQYQITAFSPTPYSPRRIIDAPNTRKKILSSPLLKRRFLYVTTNAFLFQDALATPYRTDERLRPMQEMVTAFGPKILDKKAFLSIAGSSTDKIQFFNQACISNDEKQSASFINDPKFIGNSLLLSGTSHEYAPLCNPKNILENNRIHLTYTVKQFTPNTIVLSINEPFEKPIWMLYSDVWHQDWTAQVNGQNTPVLKADIAYKAIQLTPGTNTVTFKFISPLVVFLERIIAINALLWVFFLIYLMTGIVRKDQETRLTMM